MLSAGVLQTAMASEGTVQPASTAQVVQLVQQGKVRREAHMLLLPYLVRRSPARFVADYG
jgi:CII-binding regulator of phage lambda lysogenization HflD